MCLLLLLFCCFSVCFFLMLFPVGNTEEHDAHMPASHIAVCLLYKRYEQANCCERRGIYV